MNKIQIPYHDLHQILPDLALVYDLLQPLV